MSVNSEGLSSAHWRLVMDAMPEGITVHSPEGEIQFANKGVLEIYGLPMSGFVGRHCEDIFHEGPPGCPHREVMETRKGASLEARHELGNRLYSIRLDPVIDQAGEFQGYVRVMRDVSERQKSQEQLIKAERFATLGQMISGIAHDVGTPLNIISGYSEYLLVRTSPEGQGFKELSTILQQTRRIADFIKQMLDLSRPGQGRSDPIGLKGFFTESLDLMSHHFRRSNVKASLTCNGNPPIIYADAPRLRQAFFNLLLNVFQRTGTGSRLEIIIEGREQDGAYVRIVIKGIEANGRGHDFAESFTAFLSPMKGDSILGMGLSLAREILDESGARIETLDMGEAGVPLVVLLPTRKVEASSKQN
jgi:PAS domain S-box-containing protein